MTGASYLITSQGKRVDLEKKGCNWQRWKIRARKSNPETIATTDEKISSGKGKDRKSI